MNRQQLLTAVSLDELETHLMMDPYYGGKERAVSSVISAIYSSNKKSVPFRAFKSTYSRLPCKAIESRHLILLWCGLMGLPAYRDGTALQWDWKDFLKSWTASFEIRLSDFSDFLKQEGLPLPTSIFANEPDNTEARLNLGAKKFARLTQVLNVNVPRLRGELAELLQIQPESMKARDLKKAEIERLEGEIAKLIGQKTPGAKRLTRGLNRPERPIRNELPEIGSPEWRSQNAKAAAEARHNKPGGTRDLARQMRDIWATGKYTTRDRCAEEECAGLGISLSAARKALRNTREP